MSKQQIELIRNSNRAADWKHRHGDYFVYGYVLGAERAINLHIASSSKFEKEIKSITAKVKLLFLEASTTTTEVSESISKDFDITVMGYDTTESQFVCVNSHDAQLGAGLREVYRRFAGDVNHIEQDVDDRLRQLKLHHGQSLSLPDCDRLYDSKLVSGLVLLPYRSLGIM